MHIWRSDGRGKLGLAEQRETWVLVLSAGTNLVGLARKPMAVKLMATGD